MTTIIAIDTSTRYLSIACYADNKIVAQTNELLGQKFTQYALNFVHKVMQNIITAPSLIAYGNGPGSFTGIRIATAISAALSMAHNTKMLGISSFMTYATQAMKVLKHNNQQQVIFQVLIQAGRNRYYCSSMLFSGNKLLSQQIDSCDTPEQIQQNRAKITKKDTIPWVACGNGWDNPININTAFLWKNCYFCSIDKHPIAASMIDISLSQSDSSQHNPTDMQNLNYIQDSVQK